MAGDEHHVNKGKFYLRGEGMNDKSRELYERNALGNIVSHLFPGYGEFYAVPWTAKKEIFELLSVFVKNGCDTFEYVGSLRKNGGILAEETSDLLHVLKPHMHSSSKKEVNRYLTALKQPFSRRVSELFIDDFVGRPEGKIFGWIDLGTTQIEYVDPVKLTARVNKSRIDQECSQLAGKTHIYVICKVCDSERLHYYPTVEYRSNSWLGNDKSLLENQIRLCTKSLDRCCISLDVRGPRALSVCRIPLTCGGILGIPMYDVKLTSTNCFRTDWEGKTFFAQELDFEFVNWLTSQVQGMRTKHFWQPALRKLFSFPAIDDRQVALEFLLETMKKFQTEEEGNIQLVDLSFVISNPPPCLMSSPFILASFLRGAGIVLTSSQEADDGERYEEQVVFQPENCQKYLGILEALLTVLVKGVVTEEQGKCVSQLLATEVVSLQELFYTQMGCICSPWKSLDPCEKPLLELWKNPSRTRNFLKSLGLQEIYQGNQVVVICPEDCQLLNILALFFGNID
ncbi:uncharacterized protein LOC113673023 [Pocillopora damicornis]|uniref:uncharacterized protein LOC113673023 n=1 Tax=Pocillopora damicornis TaxID=46731 RepID=UPI000F557173|nr:uncharacterized protein LOC113673023 [Pocillopora damicornis]